MANENVGVQQEQRVFQKIAYMNDDIIDQFSEGTPTLDLVESGSKVTSGLKMRGKNYGDHYTFLQRITPPKNVGVAQKATQMHPKPASSAFRRSKWRSKRLAAAIGFEQLAAYRQRGGEMSFEDRMSVEADGLISAIRTKMNKTLLGDGSGLIGTLADNGWTESGGVLTPSNINDFIGHVGTEVIFRAKQAGGLGTGTIPTGWDTLNGSPIPGVITAVGSSTVTVKQYDGSTALNTDDISSGGAAYGVYEYDGQAGQLWGLENHCSDTNPSAHGFDPADPTVILTTEDLQIDGLYGGIDRDNAANADWLGLVLTATALGGTAAPGVKKHLRPMLNRIQDRVGGFTMNDWLLGITGNDVYDAIEDELSVMIQTDYTWVLRGGHEAIAYRNLYVVKDPAAVYTQMLIFEPQSTFRFVEEDWFIDDTTGSQWKAVPGALPGRTTQQYVQNWCYIGQGIMAGRCTAAGKITGFAATN